MSVRQLLDNTYHPGHTYILPGVVDGRWVVARSDLTGQHALWSVDGRGVWALHAGWYDTAAEARKQIPKD